MGAPGVGVLTAAVGAGVLAGSLGASALVSGRRLAALEGVGVALWGLPLALGGALHGPVVLALMSVIDRERARRHRPVHAARAARA